VRLTLDNIDWRNRALRVRQAKTRQSLQLPLTDEAAKDGLVTSEEALRYALSLPIAALISGINTLEWLEKNARVAALFKPFSREEMAALELRCSSKKQ